MANILMTAVATPGHVLPITRVARLLLAAGHHVRIMTGSLFADTVASCGATIVPFDAAVDFDYRKLHLNFPTRDCMPPGNAQSALAFSDYFAGAIAVLDRQLREVMAADPVDLIVTENMFFGLLPLLDTEAPRPPVLAIGVTPLSYASADSIFYGPRIPPALLPVGVTARYGIADTDAALMTAVQRAFDNAMTTAGYARLSGYFTDVLIARVDRFLQLSTTAFEYERGDLPDTVSFIGPLADGPPADAQNDDPDDHPVVLVTQGTLANVDLEQLTLPTTRALAGRPLRVKIATGGRIIDEHLLPPNASVIAFDDYASWLSCASVLVTNGGYGSLHMALNHGVPVVVAGLGEDKAETAARVTFAGCGIDLRSSYPGEAALAAAVERILAVPGYALRAREIADDFATHDASAAVLSAVDALIARA